VAWRIGPPRPALLGEPNANNGVATQPDNDLLKDGGRHVYILRLLQPLGDGGFFDIGGRKHDHVAPAQKLAAVGEV